MDLLNLGTRSGGGVNGVHGIPPGTSSGDRSSPVLLLLAHANDMLSAHRKRAADETGALEAKNKGLPAKIERDPPSRARSIG